jgi:hypothetical protein
VRPDEVPHYKSPLPREYLVKWAERGFRHVSGFLLAVLPSLLDNCWADCGLQVTWVPHAWLLAQTAQKLKHFLEKGPSLDLVTDETLAARGDDIPQPTIVRVMEEDDRVRGEKGHTHHPHVHEPGQEGKDEWRGGGPAPDAMAESGIPIAWSVRLPFPIYRPASSYMGWQIWE